MGVQASCGWPFIEENHFIFHMLPYNFFICAGPIVFWTATFQILAKSLFTRMCHWQKGIHFFFGFQLRNRAKNLLFSLQQGFISGTELINFCSESQIIHRLVQLQNFAPYSIKVYFLSGTWYLFFCSLSSFVQEKCFMHTSLCL